MRDHTRRLEKLEGLSPKDRPYVVFGSVSIPDSDYPLTDEVIKGWLRDGVARQNMFGLRHVVHYHGNERDLTSEQWAAKYRTEMETLETSAVAKGLKR